MIFDPIAQNSRASLDKEELDKVLRIVKPYQPKVILEIGMWKGFSAEVWIKAFDPTKLITVERDHKHEDGIYYNDSRYHYLWDLDSTSDQTLDKVKGLLGGDEVDLLFIDGGHMYSEVRRDLQLYLQLVKNDGIIVMDDILYWSDACQVKPHWEELKRHWDYVEINCGDGGTGKGIFFKRKYYDKKMTEDLHQ